MSSDKDKVEEPVAKWIIKKRQKRLPTEPPDHQIVKDLIINDDQCALDKQFKRSNDPLESFVKEVFGSIKPPILSSLNNCLGIFDPNNSLVSFQIYLQKLL